MFEVAVAALLGTAPLAQPIQVTDPDPASLVVPPDVDEKARELVKQLGDPDYATREEASQALRELGRLALPAVTAGIETSDVPEVVQRCELLYPRAYHLEVRARVDCFTADSANKFKHDLPGADAFFAITGRTTAANKLYRDLILSPNSELLTAVGGAEDDVAQLVAGRRAEMNPRTVNGIRKMADPADVVALLFAETTIPDQGGGVGVNSPTYLLTAGSLRTALDTDPRKEAMAAITAKWFETRTDGRTVYAAMSAATSLKMPQMVVPLARKVLAADNATPQQKAMAVCKVAQTGSDADLPLLATLIDSEDVAYNGVVIVNGQRQNNPVQVRDVALAMSLLLTKQDPADYGLKNRYQGNTAESLKYNYITFYFEDTDGKAEEKREAAIARWYEWAGKNVKDYPKAPPVKAKKEGGEKKDDKPAPPKGK
jgi:hypothetical protein